METNLGSRLWAVLMTGIPYAVFKMVAGSFLFTEVRLLAGAIVTAWGALDLLSNLVALIAPNASAYCLLADIGRWLDKRRAGRRWENLMLAVDTLVTLLIVAAMIWFGSLALLGPSLLVAWNVAVVANITGVGIQRVWLSARGTA